MAYTYRRSKYAYLVRGESVECFAAHVLREKNKRESPCKSGVGWWHIRTAEASTRILSVEKAWGVSPRTYCARRISEKIRVGVKRASSMHVLYEKRMKNNMYTRKRRVCMSEIREVLMQELDGLKRVYREVQQSLTNAPTGRLRISHCRTTTQYYVRDEGELGNGHYLPKEKNEVARKLAQRDYDESLKKLLKERIAILKSALAVYEKGEPTDIYNSLPDERKKIVIPRYMSDEEYVEKWQSVEYIHKDFSPDVPEIYSERGERVRSKSEKIIADKLYMMGIPYRYEYPVNIPGYSSPFHPDFTILQVRTRKVYYLEHLGKMGDAEYVERNLRKINIYAKNGICVGKNLLLTFESANCPLDFRGVEEMLRKIFI